MKRILYVIDQSLDERNYERFGLQSWLDRGIAVEVWDMSALWKSSTAAAASTTEHAGLKLVRIASVRDASSRLRSIGDLTYWIDLAGDNRTSVRVKRLLVAAAIKRVVVAVGSIPGPTAALRQRLRSKIVENVAKGPLLFLDWVSNVVAVRAAADKLRPSVAVVSGEESLASLGRHGRVDVIRAHNLDYDFVLATSTSRRADQGYAVFIDQDYAFHPDFDKLDTPLWVTPEKYFPSVVAGLTAISTALGVEVVISAHPRSAYRTGSTNYFAGLRLEYGRTAELIRDCRVAICHNSTAVQFAVLFGKPIIFVTTDELQASPARESIDRFAHSLGQNSVNLDGDLTHMDWPAQLRYNPGKYDEYRRRYIKMDGSPEHPHWKIVIDHLVGPKQDS